MVAHQAHHEPARSVAPQAASESEAAARAVYDPPPVRIEVALVDAPVFARAGVPLRLRANAPDDPTSLVVRWTSGAGGDARHFPMERQNSRATRSAWTGVVPASALANGAAHLRVEAHYPSTVEVSRLYRVQVVRDVVSMRMRTGSLHATTLVERETDLAGDGLGNVLPNPEATGFVAEPQSFAIDAARGVIHVLDSANARVVALNQDTGERLSEVPLPSETVSDMVLDPNTGAVFIVDASAGVVHRIAEGHVMATVRIHTEGQPANARFFYDAETRTLAIEDFGRRAHVPLLRDGVPTMPADEADLPWVHAYAFDRGDLYLRLPDDRVAQLRIAGRVVGVDQIVTDGRGVVWATLLRRDGNETHRCLAWVDPREGIARYGDIPETETEPTRRLVGVEEGVVVLEDGNGGVRFRSYRPA